MQTSVDAQYLEPVYHQQQIMMWSASQFLLTKPSVNYTCPIHLAILLHMLAWSAAASVQLLPSGVATPIGGDGWQNPGTPVINA